MRKPRAFRPSAFDRLEDRAVPSHAAAAAMVATPHAQGLLQPFNYPQVAGDVNAVFNAFRTGFNAELNGFLNPVSGGTTVTQAQLRAYTTQAIGQLVSGLQTALGTVNGGDRGLTPLFLNQIEGTSPGALLSTLNGIPGNTGAGGAPGTLYASIANGAINTAQLAANDLLSAYALGFGVAQGGLRSTRALGPARFARVAGQVNQAFAAFRASYGGAQAAYLASAASGNGIVTQAQLQAFTSQQAGTLVQQLTTALTKVPGAASGLPPFLLNQINGGVGGDLLTGLNTIPGNTGTNGTPDALYATAAFNLLNSTQLAANNLLAAYNWGLVMGRPFARI